MSSRRGIIRFVCLGMVVLVLMSNLNQANGQAATHGSTTYVASVSSLRCEARTFFRQIICLTGGLMRVARCFCYFRTYR